MLPRNSFDVSSAVTQGEGFLSRLEQIEGFGSQFGVLPPNEMSEVAYGLSQLYNRIPQITNPAKPEQVAQSELRRICGGHADILEHSISGAPWTFENICQLFGVTDATLNNLRPWLEENRPATLEALARLYSTQPNNETRFQFRTDIPFLQEKALTFAQERISVFFHAISNLLNEAVGFDLNGIEALATTNLRSYFELPTRTLAPSMPSIIYSTKANRMNLNIPELISLLGHEGVGHALNLVMSETDPTLNPFSKRHSSLTQGTAESVAQHFEGIVFNMIAESPETQIELGLKNEFPQIAQETDDRRRLLQYLRKLNFYAINVLADSSFAGSDQPNSSKAVKRRFGALADVAINPGDAWIMIQGASNSFSDGTHLDFEPASEIKYAADPVTQALEYLKQAGIQITSEITRKINRLLLTGFWTPQGLIENFIVQMSQTQP